MYSSDGAIHFSAFKEMAKSPMHYAWRVANPMLDTPSMRLGRAVHALTLQGIEPYVFQGDRRGTKWTEFVAERLLQPVELVRGMKRHRQLQTGGFLQFGTVKAALQQQDRLSQTSLTQGTGLLDVDEGKTVGQTGQRGRHLLMTVAVGIGLDDGKGKTFRRTGFGLLIIVTDSGQIEGRADRTCHGKSI